MRQSISVFLPKRLKLFSVILVFVCLLMQNTSFQDWSLARPQLLDILGFSYECIKWYLKSYGIKIKTGKTIACLIS